MSQNLPARQGPRATETAVQKRDRETAERSAQIRADLLVAVEATRLEIEGFLSVFGIGYDLFLAGLTMFLSKQQRDQPEFFENLNIPSFVEALTRVAMNGLMPDGKEAAIAAYKDSTKGGIRVAQPMFMRDGFVKVLWRTGMVKSINDQVVTVAEYDSGRFEYEEGDQGFIRHKLDLMRKDSDPVAAAYCIIELVGGGVMREVVPKDELDKMEKMSKSPARQAWKHQMHRKSAIRRMTASKMPKEKGIVQLLAHDDETYRQLSSVRGEVDDAAESEAPSAKDLFKGRPIRRKAKPAAALAAPSDQAMDLVAPDLRDKMPVGEPQQDKRQPTQQADAPQPEPPAADAPFVLRAVLGRKNGLQQFDNVDLWYGDVRQKMQSLTPDLLPAFWELNREHVADAGRNGYPAEAMKLIGFAKELGLLEVSHGE